MNCIKSWATKQWDLVIQMNILFTLVVLIASVFGSPRSILQELYGQPEEYRPNHQKRTHMGESWLSHLINKVLGKSIYRTKLKNSLSDDYQRTIAEPSD